MARCETIDNFSHEAIDNFSHETFRSKFVNRDPWKNGIAEGTPCMDLFVVVVVVVIVVVVVVVVVVEPRGKSCCSVR